MVSSTAQRHGRSWRWELLVRAVRCPRSAVAEPNTLSAPLAALIALGEEEGPAPSGKPMAEDPAEELHPDGPTLTSIFPMFSPRRSPRKACGAFPIPSMIVSR
jgi:hypothetical protein